MLGEDGQPLGVYVGEAAVNFEAARGRPVMDRHDPFSQGGHERGMTGQHAEVTLGARRIDAINLAGEDLPLWRDQGEVELVGHYAASIAIFSAFSTASSMAPTM